MEKYTTFQTVDSEGDIWCNRAILFKNDSLIEEFFSNPEKIVATLELEVNEDEDINECIEVLRSRSGVINGAVIRLEYCGECKLLRMSGGYIIE